MQTLKVVKLGTLEGENSREVQLRNGERKKTFTVAIVLGIWIASNLPLVRKLLFTLTRNSDYCKEAVAILKLDMWAKYFVALKSCTNLFVYCYRSKEIRKAAFKIIWPKHRANTAN